MGNSIYSIQYVSQCSSMFSQFPQCSPMFSYVLLSSPIISYHLLSSSIISYHLLASPIISYHLLSSHIIFYHLLSSLSSLIFFRYPMNIARTPIFFFFIHTNFFPLQIKSNQIKSKCRGSSQSRISLPFPSKFYPFLLFLFSTYFLRHEQEPLINITYNISG